MMVCRLTLLHHLHISVSVFMLQLTVLGARERKIVLWLLLCIGLVLTVGTACAKLLLGTDPLMKLTAFGLVSIFVGVIFIEGINDQSRPF